MQAVRLPCPCAIPTDQLIFLACLCCLLCCLLCAGRQSNLCVLRASGCHNLHEVVMTLPMASPLTELSLNDCKALSKLVVVAPALQSLHVGGCRWVLPAGTRVLLARGGRWIWPSQEGIEGCGGVDGALPWPHCTLCG